MRLQLATTVWLMSLLLVIGRAQDSARAEHLRDPSATEPASHIKAGRCLPTLETVSPVTTTSPRPRVRTSRSAPRGGRR